MLTRTAVAAITLLLLIPSHVPARQRAADQASPVKFSGEVSRGQEFDREFGPGLVFKLRTSKDPETPGWTIEVLPKGETSPEVEFSWLVTPPYRFFNPRYLEVSYGYSAQEIVRINPREFRFVRDGSAHERGSAAVRQLLWPYGIEQAELDEAQKTLSELPTGRGSLRILDSRTGESIEWLKFEVELNP